MQLARRCVRSVLLGELPMKEFVISKALRGDYKNEEQPHLCVACNVRQRTGEHLPSGMRVPYVFVEDAELADSLLARRAEDPAWAADKGLPLDWLYYVDHQLATPITNMLMLLVDDPTAAVFGHDSVAPALAVARAKRRHKNICNGQLELTRFFLRPKTLPDPPPDPV